jgi:hypothetical protein
VPTTFRVIIAISCILVLSHEGDAVVTPVR